MNENAVMGPTTAMRPTRVARESTRARAAVVMTLDSGRRASLARDGFPHCCSHLARSDAPIACGGRELRIRNGDRGRRRTDFPGDEPRPLANDLRVHGRA